MKYYKTRNWRPALPVTFLLIITGLITGSEIILYGSFVSLSFMIFDSFSTIQENPITVERKIKPKNPDPGDEIKILLKVENESSKTLSDVRIVDDIPENLIVTSGFETSNFILKPSQIKKVEYSLSGDKGFYQFESPEVKLGTFNSSEYGFMRPEVEGDKEIECKINSLTKKEAGSFEDFSLNHEISGVEFHSLREYESSDPLNKVEWRHFAKTGELATVNFRQKDSKNIILFIDNRKVGDVIGDKDIVSERKKCFYSAKMFYETFKDSKHSIKLTGIGMEYKNLGLPTTGFGLPLIDIKEDKQLVSEFFSIKDREALEGEKSYSSEASFQFLEQDSIILFFSTLLDDEASLLAKRLKAEGHNITVLSPSSPTEGLGGRIEGFERDVRIKKLRQHVNVVNWRESTPLSKTVSKTLEKMKSKGEGENENC